MSVRCPSFGFRMKRKSWCPDRRAILQGLLAQGVLLPASGSHKAVLDPTRRGRLVLDERERVVGLGVQTTHVQPSGGPYAGAHRHPEPLVVERLPQGGHPLRVEDGGVAGGVPGGGRATRARQVDDRGAVDAGLGGAGEEPGREAVDPLTLRVAHGLGEVNLAPGGAVDPEVAHAHRRVLVGEGLRLMLVELLNVAAPGEVGLAPRDLHQEFVIDRGGVVVPRGEVGEAALCQLGDELPEQRILDRPVACELPDADAVNVEARWNPQQDPVIARQPRGGGEDVGSPPDKER